MQLTSITPISKSTVAEVCVPGSKSYSLRVLLISALCDDKFKIENLLDSTDTAAMENCLLEMKDSATLYADESGVTARFLTALACIKPGEQIINGTSSLQKRPISPLVDALRGLGADIKYLENDGFLPIQISSSELISSQIEINGDISSQYVSALLLIAPGLKNGLTINVLGEQISKPYIDMTIDIMNHFGIRVDNQNYKKYVVNPQKYLAKDYVVEADYSSSSYFYSINALFGTDIKVVNLNPKSLQGDKKYCDLIFGGIDKLSPKLSVLDYPDQAMTLAVLLAFKAGKSVLTGVKSLRIKETERVKALENELAKMGIKTDSTEDTLTIYGGQPKPANIDTYGDHRVAMSFAVASTKLNKLSIYNPNVVNKTFPGFWNELRKITEVDIQEHNYSKIVLTGMRGTGKSTVGKLVAKRLSMDFVDVDTFIESQNKINIKQTVQKHGWAYFRKLETEAIAELSNRTNTVISTGAGAVMFDENVEKLKKDSLVFMLKADPAVLARRIYRYNKLPALTNKKSVHEEMLEVWRQRGQRYYMVSDFIIDTDNLSPNQVASEIIAKIKT